MCLKEGFFQLVWNTITITNTNNKIKTTDEKYYMTNFGENFFYFPPYPSHDGGVPRSSFFSPSSSYLKRQNVFFPPIPQTIIFIKFFELVFKAFHNDQGVNLNFYSTENPDCDAIQTGRMGTRILQLMISTWRCKN